MKRTLASLQQQQWRVTSPSRQPRIRNLPRNILLLRHGQSLGNVDENMFVSTPDWKIPLSEHGKQQAREAGLLIKKIVRDSPLVIYVSPYKRTKETLAEVQKVLTNNTILFSREEPRLREQDFGNFQDPDKIQLAKQERPKFGRFFYRFPAGESGADVFDR
jgi:broad specificity phosphatase PhoE